MAACCGRRSLLWQIGQISRRSNGTWGSTRETQNVPLFFLVGRQPDVLAPEYDELHFLQVEGGAQEGFALGARCHVGWVLFVEPLPPGVGLADLEADGEVGLGGRGHALGGDELLE